MKMRKTKEQMNRLAALLGLTAFAVAEALAQENQAPENQARPARRIVISISDRRLAVLESGRVLKVFPTAVGAPRTPSPAGSYRIVQRVVNPTWYSKGKVVPPGKSNPLGTRWIGLSAKGYGIHGTNNPSSIGANVSHGCIRMRNRDVEELFVLVSVGDSVDLYTERTPELDSIFGFDMAVTGQ
jgi:lipoprotein-anchoring transpeptidase ErfK/SrfK